MDINIETLMKEICLPEEVRERIRIIEKMDKGSNPLFKHFSLINDLNSIYDAPKAYSKLKASLIGDKDGFMMLCAFLHASLNTYIVYKENDFPEQVFIDTMKNLTFYVEEYKKKNGHYGFDKGEEAYKLTSFVMYNFGIFNYEIKEIGQDNQKIIFMHARDYYLINESRVKKSLAAFNTFIKEYWLDFVSAPIYCYSFLLSKEFLFLMKDNSSYINFAKMFTVLSSDYKDKFLEDIFYYKEKDFALLKEDNEIQKKVKEYLLLGGKITNCLGRLKDNN